MEIVGKGLTDCQVDPTGVSFRLGFESVDGQPASVILPVDCLRALLMTLPHVIEKALKAGTEVRLDLKKKKADKKKERRAPIDW